LVLAAAREDIAWRGPVEFIRPAGTFMFDRTVALVASACHSTTPERENRHKTGH